MAETKNPRDYVKPVLKVYGEVAAMTGALDMKGMADGGPNSSRARDDVRLRRRRADARRRPRAAWPSARSFVCGRHPRLRRRAPLLDTPEYFLLFITLARGHSRDRRVR